MFHTDTHSEIFEKAATLWEATAPTMDDIRELGGGLSFKTVNGADYLVRTWTDMPSGKRKTKSLGRRSPETEEFLTQFQEQKAATLDRWNELNGELDMTCRMAKAQRIARVPAPIGFFHRANWLSNSFSGAIATAGPFALSGYEVLAGQMCDVPAQRRAEPAYLRIVTSDPSEFMMIGAYAAMLAVDERRPTR